MIATPIHKKCDQLDLQNYGAIALLSIGKIFLCILMNRMKEKIQNTLKETQCRLCLRTTDVIFIVRQIIEKAKRKKIPLNFHFIDFKSAFNQSQKENLGKYSGS